MPSQLELEKTWSALLEHVSAEIPGHVYRVWLEPLRVVGLSGGVLFVHAPSGIRDWVRRRFGEALSRALRSLDDSLVRVELVSDVPGVAGDAQPRPHGPRLKPAYRFEEFVIGAGNRFAHAASLAAAELPGQAYNPLFLHGTTGVGKTHLLNAIGNYTTGNDDSLAVLYATGETFTSDFTSAIRGGQMDVFKERYRQADLMLLDDLQFVENKPRTAEELLHTFDALITKGAQVVIAADRLPSAMPALATRLRDRFESGLVVEVEMPNFETRLSIIRKRAAGWVPPIEQPEALDVLAGRISSSVHALEGALIRVRAYASLTQEPITPALVEHVLANLYASSPTTPTRTDKVTVERIQQATSDALALPLTDLNSAKRGRQVVYARQVAMYLCRELTDLSLPVIGQRFGGRDHTTVLHAHRQMRARILTEEPTRQLVDKILIALGPAAHTS
jgi:chromosomal replication initiator protein